MDANEFLASFTIPTPCPMDWDHMRGNDRARFCEQCGKNVHNLTIMTPDEAASFLSVVRENGERRCVRLYQRPDGTLTTSACQPTPRAAAGPWQFTIRAIMAVIAGFAALLGLAKWISPEHQQSRTPPPAGAVIGGDVY